MFGWTVGAPTALEILDVFASYGGRVIDTADVYSAWLPGNSGGESEAIIGRWLVKPGNRDRVVVSTKVGQHPDAPGLTAESVRRAVEASLKRLRTDRIDLLFAHYDDDETPLDETVGVFSDLVDEGKIRYPAASNYTGARMRQARAIADRDGKHPFAAVQPAYNLVRRPSTRATWPRSSTTTTWPSCPTRRSPAASSPASTATSRTSPIRRAAAGPAAT
ncbi:aldo/keto reductase [Frondihabitans sp. PAMC 28766]|uniref:aldo/keto reductase n=1 Tax=Frondihabitans sp. PAMC 28766 TaxID=1795630 RepID=UPI000B30F82B